MQQDLFLSRYVLEKRLNGEERSLHLITMSDAKLPVDVSVKNTPASSVKGVSEYDEYLQLAEEFQGDRLKKTIRKV